MEEEAVDYRALYEQAQAALQQRDAALQQRDAALQQAQAAVTEEKRRRQQLEQLFLARGTEDEAARFNDVLDSMLNEKTQLQHQAEQVNPQPLPAYLAQISRLQAHAARLIPRPVSGSIPAHVQKDKASNASSSSQVSTSGRTDIVKKLYPLRLRRWSGFVDDVQRAGFSRIYAALHAETQSSLPSHHGVRQVEKDLLRQLPLFALEQDGGLNAARTNTFLNAALLIPASRILEEYANHGTASAKHVFIDTDVQAVRAFLPPVTSPQSDEEGGAEDSGRMSQGKKRKVMPDHIVLFNDSETGPAKLVAVGEQKPLHAMRAATVKNILESPLPEDAAVRLARQYTARQQKKLAEKAAKEGQTSQGSRLRQEPEGESAEAASKTKRIDKQTYFLYALAQTYHYMLLAGVEYGYLVTGEVILFLRIQEDDATTMYYHPALFPLPGLVTAAGSLAPLPEEVSVAPSPSPGDPTSEEALASLPISQLVSFCELALHSSRRPPLWLAQQAANLKYFPDLPPDFSARLEKGPASILGRRDYRDDDDGGDGGHTGGSDDSGSSRLPQQLQQRLQQGGNSASAGSPLQQQIRGNAANTDISTSFLPASCNLHERPRPSCRVALPTLPYCTQACLLSLAQNGPLDQHCPNYTLHQEAKGKGSAAGKNISNRHPLTSFELAQRMQDQLFATPGVDCQLFVKRRGAVGYPFKLTLTGFGYTFIGKAVEEMYGQRLVHESKVYQALFPLQGSVIPVHLGLIELHFGYPVQDLFLQVPCMMLLSYAGESMAPALLVDEDDDEEEEEEEEKEEVSAEVAGFRAEAARTMEELHRWGFDDKDNNVSNFRWCEETGRAMRIDFDRVYLSSLKASPSQASQASVSYDTPSTLVESDDVPDSMLQKMHADEPAAKRQKVRQDDSRDACLKLL